MHLEAVIKLVWRYALGGHDRANLEAATERVWRPLSSEFGDALGGHNRASLEIHLEAVIDRVWRYAPGGRTRARLDEYLEAVDGRRAGC